MNQLQTLKGHTDGIYCLTPFNGYLYSGSADKTIIKWNKNGTINQTLKGQGHSGPVWCLTEFNGHLYSGNYDKTIIKWNKDGTINQTLKGHYTSGLCVTDRLYSGSSDIIKWNRDGTIKNMLKGHSDAVFCLTEFNGYLYSGSADNTIIKWGKFNLRDYSYLSDEKKRLLDEASKLLYIYKVCKDVRLLIYRYLL
jgi:WD40 repeat protein